MAQAKRKRTRKHRGTAAGTIERAGRTGRPRTREEAKKIARERRQQRFDKPPTWKGALQRAGIAAALFGVLVIALFQRTVAPTRSSGSGPVSSCRRPSASSVELPPPPPKT
jgi:hypothetical protein